MLTSEEKERLNKLKKQSDNKELFTVDDTDFLQSCYNKDPEYYRSLITNK